MTDESEKPRGGKLPPNRKLAEDMARDRASKAPEDEMPRRAFPKSVKGRLAEDLLQNRPAKGEISNPKRLQELRDHGKGKGQKAKDIEI